MNKILEIIYPEEIEKQEKVLKLLSNYGINHRNPNPTTGWNYMLDHVWLINQFNQYFEAKEQQYLTCLDIGCGNSKFHNFLEDHFQFSMIGIDRADGYCHQKVQKNVDYTGDFQNCQLFQDNSVDIILWLSSIEHNKPSTIKLLYEKSMNLLKPNGLLLATIAVSRVTQWFEQAQQTNINLGSVQNIFGNYEVIGDYDKAHEQYQKDHLFLRQRYDNRFGDFSENDPAYIVAGLRCEKTPSKNNIEEDMHKITNEYSPIILAPSNDTHVQWMTPIAKQLDNPQFMIIPERMENADKALQDLGFDYLNYSPGLLVSIPYALIILGNDWGKEERQIIRESRMLGIPSICIQEGPLQFSKTLNHLRNAEIAFIQGKVMKQYLESQNTIITGNPKYDSYQKKPLPEKPCVMINCNFTYGVYEEYRDEWVEDTVRACEALNIDYFISQHPRDTGELPEDYKIIKSNAFLVEEQLERSSILISRFSTLIYEALLLGRSVIYYDPMHETFPLIKENNNGAIFYADRFDSLHNVLQESIEKPVDKQLLRNFLELHCNGVNNNATNACVREINKIYLETFSREKSHNKINKISHALLKYIVQNDLLTPSQDEVQILQKTNLEPIINDIIFVHFVEFLAERAETRVVVIKNLVSLCFNKNFQKDSIIVIPKGVWILKNLPELARHLIELSKNEQKIILVDNNDSFSGMPELHEVVKENQLPIEFTGYTKVTMTKAKFVIILSNPVPTQYPSSPQEFRIVAFITTYNDGDIILPAIHYLFQNNIEVYVIDLWSTDGAFEKVKQIDDEKFIGTERWPKSGPNEKYGFTGLQKRIDYLRQKINADWFIQLDADELLESPWKNVDLRDAIYQVDQRGYNQIDFSVLNFFPVDNNYQPGKSLSEHFRYFDFGRFPPDTINIQAWKNTNNPFDINTQKIKDDDSSNLSVFPYKFLLKHYPIRSQDQAYRKFVSNRMPYNSRKERCLQWQIGYEFSPTAHFIRDPKGLIEFNSEFYSNYLIERLSGIGISPGNSTNNSRKQPAAGVSQQDQRFVKLNHKNNSNQHIKHKTPISLLGQLRKLVFPDKNNTTHFYNKFFERTKIFFSKNQEKSDRNLVKESGFFDKNWYLDNNPDVAQSNMDPLSHFLRYGGLEGRDPGPNFNSSWYLITYEDVRNSNLNPLIHYLKYGIPENRQIQPSEIKNRRE